MLSYEKLSTKELKEKKEELMKKYSELKLLDLDLNMARGKPSKEQLDLSLDMIKNFDVKNLIKTKDNKDARNYLNLDETVEAREFFANLLDVEKDMVFIGGNSSLNLMYTYISNAMQFGIMENTPWNKLEKIKFLCPCPGYDRHFAICELFNIEMINVKMNEDGPDVQKIKELVEKDALIKGLWCVPKYSNPTGITYSDEIVKTLASLKPAAKDFRIFWDNAYFIHDLNEKEDELLNIFDECKKNNNMNMVLEFASTSKITFPGSGVSALIASEENLKDIKKIVSKQIICYNSVNQIMHYKFLSSKEKVEEHMKKHAKIIKPKFDLVLKTFEEKLKPLNIANWTIPNGGYFISFNSLDGCAKRIFNLCENVGVILTSPGATFPYQKDPDDKNIRIAPTYPNIDELKTALEVFCLCVEIASIEKFLN